jgi:hypothetical protein
MQTFSARAGRSDHKCRASKRGDALECTIFERASAFMR